MLSFDFLDEVALIPNRIPAHKEVSKIEVEHRYTMLQRISNELFFNNRVFVSDVELNRFDTSWMIDTVNYYKHHVTSELYLVIGTDSFFQLHNWKNSEALLESVKLIVFGREVVSIETLDEYLKDKFGEVDYILSHYEGLQILDWVSSTIIRQKLIMNENIVEYVPEIIFNYIQKYNLYKN